MAILLLNGSSTDKIDQNTLSRLTISGFDADPELILVADPRYLVNFQNNLPGGNKRAVSDKETKLIASIQAYAKQGMSVEEIINSGFANADLHSRKRLDQSLNQFLAEIDETIAQKELTETVLRLRKDMNEASFMDVVRAKTKELETLVKPVYLKLRETGFKHYDLVQ